MWMSIGIAFLAAYDSAGRTDGLKEIVRGRCFASMVPCVVYIGRNISIICKNIVFGIFRCITCKYKFIFPILDKQGNGGIIRIVVFPVRAEERYLCCPQ